MILNWVGFIVAVAAGIATDKWLGLWVGALSFLVILIATHSRSIVKAARGRAQARRDLEDEQARPFIEEYEQELAKRDADDAARLWETRYEVPLITFGPLSHEAQKEVRTGIERLREPLVMAAEQLKHILKHFGDRLEHEQPSGRPWGKWVAPQVLGQADLLDNAMRLFEEVVKSDADSRLAFYTFYVCYRKSERFHRRVAAIEPAVVSGDIYYRLVERNEMLATALRETLAPREFQELREHLKTALGEVGY